MAANPKHLTAAKSWFRLAKYESCRSLTACQWGQQIARRVFVREALKLKNQGFLDKEIPRLADDPVSDWPYQASIRSVRGLSLKDMRRLLTAFKEEDFSDNDPIDSCVSDSLSSLAPFGHLVIDLNARDQDIKKEFSHWLAERRSDTTINRIGNLKTSVFRRWHSAKLLPYCDLKAWGKWQNKPLTELQILQLLFPQSQFLTREALRPITDNVKKYVTLSNAHALMAPDSR